jgi:transglutaminase-like putative cysteine protease
MNDQPKPTRFAVDCTLDYQLDAACDFVFMVHAAQSHGQRVHSETLTLSDGAIARTFVEGAGNRVLRVHAPAGALHLHYLADVEREPILDVADCNEWPVQDLPDDTLPHLLPTRYCESDLLSGAAQKIFGGLPAGLQRAQAVSDWIHQNIEYRLGSSTSTTTARDVFVQRAGVCRDFSHLGVTFCRALNIPARLVCGYARFDEPPPDFHAVFEAFVGGRWHLFDPTQLASMDALVRIATGRDAKDVVFATIFGPAQLLAMSPCIEPLMPQPAKVAEAQPA